jgi:hypothetical protein
LNIFIFSEQWIIVADFDIIHFLFQNGFIQDLNENYRRQWKNLILWIHLRVAIFEKLEAKNTSEAILFMQEIEAYPDPFLTIVFNVRVKKRNVHKKI